jgi:phosphocarrier protein HPr
LINNYTDSFVVLNDKGLHTRPCAEIVRCAAKFKSLIWIHCGNRKVEAKSLLGILTLAAAKGSQIQVSAEGEDARAAVKALLNLAKKKFNLDY